jgi:zinc D-Ala-D-Ala carboxypeptidase
MRSSPRVLLNTPDIEAWPAWGVGGGVTARWQHQHSTRDARTLARARWVLRRKRDGRFLSAAVPEGWMALDPHWMREAGLETALDAAETHSEHMGTREPITLPLHRLRDRLDGLGLDADDYAARTRLALEPEPAWLALAGFDRYRRPLWLQPKAARAWQRLRTAAASEGIVLEAISGYRSHDYQLGIFERKRARGQSIEQILTVNAAPGYSEHHSGTALDIGTPGEPPAEESFERTAAFAWLQAHASEFGARMSYPRDNPHGIVYEPWHWRFLA